MKICIYISELLRLEVLAICINVHLECDPILLRVITEFSLNEIL